MKNLPAWLSVAVAFMAFASTTVLAVGNLLRDRRNNTREAYAIALAIIPDLFRLRAEISSIGAKLRVLQVKIESMDGVLNDTALAEAFRSARLSTPYLLERNIDRLGKLERRAGKACLETISTLTHYQRDIAKLVDRLAAGEAVNGSQAMKDIEGMLRILALESHHAGEEVNKRYKVL